MFKHAEASAVDIYLTYTDDDICLIVSDNGRGFDPAHVAAERLGLNIMRERAEGIGAEYAVESHAEGGARVTLRWSEGEIDG